MKENEFDKLIKDKLEQNNEESLSSDTTHNIYMTVKRKQKNLLLLSHAKKISIWTLALFTIAIIAYKGFVGNGNAESSKENKMATSVSANKSINIPETNNSTNKQIQASEVLIQETHTIQKTDNSIEQQKTQVAEQKTKINKAEKLIVNQSNIIASSSIVNAKQNKNYKEDVEIKNTTIQASTQTNKIIVLPQAKTTKRVENVKEEQLNNLPAELKNDFKENAAKNQNNEIEKTQVSDKKNTTVPADVNSTNNQFNKEKTAENLTIKPNDTTLTQAMDSNINNKTTTDDYASGKILSIDSINKKSADFKKQVKFQLGLGLNKYILAYGLSLSTRTHLTKNFVIRADYYRLIRKVNKYVSSQDYNTDNESVFESDIQANNSSITYSNIRSRKIVSGIIFQPQYQFALNQKWDAGIGLGTFITLRNTERVVYVKSDNSDVANRARFIRSKKALNNLLFTLYAQRNWQNWSTQFGLSFTRQFANVNYIKIRNRPSLDFKLLYTFRK